LQGRRAVRAREGCAFWQQVELAVKREIILFLLRREIVLFWRIFCVDDVKKKLSINSHK
jgi:hypothetical protein